MSSNHRESHSYDYESIFDAADDYIASGNRLPDVEDEPRNTPVNHGKKSENSPVVDGDAYCALTKADPHYHTQFRPSDVRHERWAADFLKLKKENYFEMLGRINRGEQNGTHRENTELRTYEWNQFFVQNIAGRLNLTELQFREAVARATNIDTEKFGERLELVVYCTCAYVVHQDKTTDSLSRRKCHYNTSDENKDELFLEVAESLGLRMKEIRRVYAKLEQQFHEMSPPTEFDDRKPGWEPNKHQSQEIVSRPPKTSPVPIWEGYINPLALH